MKVPPFVGSDPKDYLEHLGRQIDRADAKWTAYAAALTKDYTHAFSKQADALTGVKKVLDAQKAFEHDKVTFALSLLTVGLSGAVSGIVARSETDFLTSSKDAAIKEIGKRWEDAIKDTSKAVIKKQTDSLGAAIAPKATVTADPFAPAGVTPTEYWSGMVQGFATLKSSLADFRDGLYQRPPFQLRLDLPDLPLQYYNNGPLDTAGTKRLVDEILATRYFADCPEPDKYPPGKFFRNISLALWIGWAYQRDVKYWKLQHDITEYYSINEQVSWDNLRPVLRDLGVPVQNITPAYIIPDVSGKRVDGLDMWGFFRWIASPASRVSLFSGLSRNAEGFELTDKAMKKMQLTEMGWVQH